MQELKNHNVCNLFEPSLKYWARYKHNFPINHPNVQINILIRKAEVKIRFKKR
jgi:hypothetical protein